MKTGTITLFALLLAVSPAFSEIGDWHGFMESVGDLDQNGRWDLNDIVILQGYLAGAPKPEGIHLDSLDVNRDGRIDLGDLGDFVIIVMSHPERSRPAPPPRPGWYRVGDVNHDQKIDVADVVVLGEYLARRRGNLDAPLDAADVNEDGRINSEDSKPLQDAAFGAQ